MIGRQLMASTTFSIEGYRIAPVESAAARMILRTRPGRRPQATAQPLSEIGFGCEDVVSPSARRS